MDLKFPATEPDQTLCFENKRRIISDKHAAWMAQRERAIAQEPQPSSASAAAAAPAETEAAAVEAVEISPAVVEAAREWFGISAIPDETLRVHTSCALEWMRCAEQPIDVLLIDLESGVHRRDLEISYHCGVSDEGSLEHSSRIECDVRSRLLVVPCIGSSFEREGHHYYEFKDDGLHLIRVDLWDTSWNRDAQGASAPPLVGFSSP